MSWKFPKYRIKDDQVVSVDEVTENVLEYADEIGRLDENNWTQNFVSDRTTMTPGIALVSHHSTRTQGIQNSGLFDANVGSLTSTESWVPIAGLSKSFGTSGGLVWILASFQTSSLVRSIADDVGGALWAIRVDGQVIVESVIGSQELDNDQTVKSGNYKPSAGVARWRIPITAEAMLNLSEGQHTVELVGMALLGSAGVLPSPLNTVAYGSTVVSVGQLIIIELLR